MFFAAIVAVFGFIPTIGCSDREESIQPQDNEHLKELYHNLLSLSPVFMSGSENEGTRSIESDFVSLIGNPVITPNHIKYISSLSQLECEDFHNRVIVRVGGYEVFDDIQANNLLFFSQPSIAYQLDYDVYGSCC